MWKPTGRRQSHMATPASGAEQSFAGLGASA